MHLSGLLLKAAALLILAFTSTQLSAELDSVDPERAGMSPQRLERINQHMKAAVEQGVIVGGQGMIARHGQVVFNETWGMSDRESNTRMERDAIYRIYSMTKPITAVAVMMLYEEGHFMLNEPVAKYLPEFAGLELALSTADSHNDATSDGTTSLGGNADADESLIGQTRKPRRQPTIRDLLRHTAGLSYGLFGESEIDRRYLEARLFFSPDLETFVDTLATIPLQYEPGTRWHYSVSFEVLSRLVEVVSGLSFEAFLARRVFEPLGMRDTSYLLPESKSGRLATIYTREQAWAGWDGVWRYNADGRLQPSGEHITARYHKNVVYSGGGSGLLSTAEDYMRFCLMLLNDGEFNGARLLSPTTVKLMTRNHTGTLPGAAGSGIGFGLGFSLVVDAGITGELVSDGAYFWGGAAGTRFWIDPQEELVGIFMVQSIPNNTRIRDQFRILTYQAITE